MTDEPLKLTDEQLSSYQREGYLVLPGGPSGPLTSEWLEALRSASTQFVQQSRLLTESNQIFDLEPEHTAELPRLRRLVSPVDHHEAFYRFAIDGPAAHLACALLGGPARFHHSKLNFKWSGGGEEVKWHQDIQFWPHTDFTPLTIGVYLDDVDDEMGPMGVLPGSHRGELYNQYDSEGAWVGAMSETDIDQLDMDSMVWLQGPAGSMTAHNACMVHGSSPNHSERARPLLLQTYSAVDSYPLLGLGANGMGGAAAGTVVGGDSTQSIEIEGRRLRGAPDWPKGDMPTIFGSQQNTVSDK